MGSFSKKTLAILLCMSVFVFALLPATHKANAVSDEIDFGGMQLFTLDEGVCDCSFTNLHFILDYKTNSLLVLYYDYTGTIYNNYDLEAGIYQLGSYLPGDYPCLVYSGNSCFTLYTATGTYGNDPGTGTSERSLPIDLAKAMSGMFPSSVHPRTSSHSI